MRSSDRKTPVAESVVRTSVVVTRWFCCRYLIPCSHVMISQQRCVRDPEMYSRTPEKLISLMPACSFVHSSLEGASSSATLEEVDELRADKSATYVTNDTGRLHFLDRSFAPSKIWTERKLRQKVKWIFLFGLSPNFGVSERLIQNVKSPTVLGLLCCHTIAGCTWLHLLVSK